MKIAVLLALMAAAGAAQAQKLGEGLTLVAFQKAYAARVKFDNEKAAALHSCKDKAGVAGRRAYQCRIGVEGSVDGVMGADARLMDITVRAPNQSPADVYLFQRAAKYAIYAAQNTTHGPAAMTIQVLMSGAARRPGVPLTTVEDGMRYTATLDQSKANPDVSVWTFSIERP